MMIVRLFCGGIVLKKLLLNSLLIILIMSLSGCSFVTDKLGALFNSDKNTVLHNENTEQTVPIASESSTIDSSESSSVSTEYSDTQPTEVKSITYTDVEDYLFTVTNPELIIYDAPEGEYSRTFGEVGVYTIIEEAVDAEGARWGKLKSGVGWVRFDGSALPELDLWLTTGAGGFATSLKIYSDGTFSGVSSDTEYGDNGSEYPNGTIYYCEFSGKFTDVSISDSFTLNLRPEYVDTTHTVGKTEIKDGVRYIYTSPTGISESDEYHLYLPGMTTESLPAVFLNWHLYCLGQYGETLSCYALHNLNSDFGFFES